MNDRKIEPAAGACPQRCRRKARSYVALLAMALMVSMPFGSANAVVFHDVIHTIQNIFTQLWTESKDAAQYSWDKAEQARHLAQMVKEYEAQLSGIVNFMDASMSMGADFKERSASDVAKIAANRCPGSKGMPSLSELWRSFIPDPSKDIEEQQLELCQRIVMAESERYNEQVRMLKRIVDNSKQLERLARQREAMGAGANPGELDSNSNDIERFTARASMDMQYAQTVMTAYDGYIASLQTSQQELAMQAMRGERKPWGTVVQGATLKGALEAQQ
jgi:hypothetical protein